LKDNTLFNEYAKEILENDIYNECKKLFSHGGIRIYDHSISVARMAFSFVERSKTIDKRAVVRAALLHDFFLYEWHIWGWRYVKHGWVHPKIAANKSRVHFGISDKEYSAIKTHMWPWTPFAIPRSREAWAISLADKIVAVTEALFFRGKRYNLCDPDKDVIVDNPGAETA
jgi:uncharacterized protein